ncbi:lipopolysaccharide-induced tumor necrosis factor-alpha factor homolog [Tetranychus urticae]|uniref:LITAF domain-containing protein n=1 Tax=Tetranychus urticae TaxID=32264 RepID=T1KY40_TETUR|nr:lipopolysaccharide-induced tumor necrosis factor-alpha factor homolog [Tetranychus urticae]
MDSKSGYPQFSASAPAPAPDFGPPPPYQVENHPPLTTNQRAPLISSSINDTPVHYEHPIQTPKPIYGPYAQTDYCPRCKQTIATRTAYKVGFVTWVASAACILVGGFLGCCLIPCCTDFTRDVEHYCPNCHLKLGLHQRI